MYHDYPSGIVFFSQGMILAETQRKKNGKYQVTQQFKKTGRNGEWKRKWEKKEKEAKSKSKHERKTKGEEAGTFYSTGLLLKRQPYAGPRLRA